MTRSLLLILCLSLLQSCQKKTNTPTEIIPAVKAEAGFTLMPPATTGIMFSNYTKDFKEDYTHNIFTYEYMYNGGGVAAGDVNGDSLPDLYFTSTFSEDKLYLNLGHFKFLDVTAQSGVVSAEGFKTGTVMADINGDGKLDIYVCRTSLADDGQKNDHAFINMGNKIVNGVAIPFFEDQSKKLGLDDNSNTDHACFFDYDRDGDLDLFLLNHRLDVNNVATLRLQQDKNGSVVRITTPMTPFESNRLFRNDNGHFTDVTVKAGLESSAFGLSATVADLNMDGWMDIFVANDYIEPDRVYINNHDGTFTDHFSEYLKHTSHNSMGSDVADINNDGLDDIMVLDMKSGDPFRYKILENGMHYDRYNILERYGYGRQVGRNVLQLNNGNNTFSEIGQFAGVATTDWSWGSLIADFNNDGWKDIYIANGFRRDVTDLDYMNFVKDSIDRAGGLTPSRVPDINVVLKLIPEHKIQNYLFINNEKLAFINATSQAGMNKPSWSSGSAFADLDRDGDLDLIVNNIIDTAFIYRNDFTGNHWFQIDIQGKKGNTDGIGSSVDLYAGGIHQHEMMITNKGFFSSSEPIIHFGLGATEKIDSIILRWPQGQEEIMRSLTADRRITWSPGKGDIHKHTTVQTTPLLFTDVGQIPGWRHRENAFVDFKREKLLPYMLSCVGPCMSTGDVNGDKLDDIYVGNGSSFPSALFLQNPNGTFSESPNAAFLTDSIYEDCGSLLADFDGDGDKDLIVVSGGSSFDANDPHYLSRYYTNDGKGHFIRSVNFPRIITNASAIIGLDYDHDKDIDIIITGRSIPGRFPEYPKSFLLRNDKGRFTDVTQSIFPDLDHLGMITSVASADLNGDQKPEVVFVGEWMPITVYSYDGKSFKNRTSEFGFDKTTGWWKSISLADVDKDGDPDLIAGNIGLNSRLVTSEEHPITLITKDFDGNGSLDPIMCFYYNGQLYPYQGKDAMISQIPVLKKKFIRYGQYASATINDIFTKDELKGSTTLTTNTFETKYFVNDHGKFVEHPLPFQVQLAPVYSILVEDFNQDGRKDILMAGNFLYSETETGEMDAGNGTLLLQNADGTFHYVPNLEHGFWAQGEVRVLKSITLANGKNAILTANNKGPIQIHTLLNKVPDIE